MEKINYQWDEQQTFELDDCRRKAAEIARYINSLSWLFEPNTKEESILIKYSYLAEKIETFCEEQLPF